LQHHDLIIDFENVNIVAERSIKKLDDAKKIGIWVKENQRELTHVRV